jgi:hypothetical protein
VKVSSGKGGILYPGRVKLSPKDSSHMKGRRVKNVITTLAHAENKTSHNAQAA